MVYMYKEIAETCCLGVYGLIRPEIEKPHVRKKRFYYFIRVLNPGIVGWRSDAFGASRVSALRISCV